MPDALQSQHKVYAEKPKILPMTLAHVNEEVPAKKLESARMYFAYLFRHRDAAGLVLPPTLADTLPGSPQKFPYEQPRRVQVIAGTSLTTSWYMVIPTHPPEQDVNYCVVVNDSLTVNQIL